MIALRPLDLVCVDTSSFVGGLISDAEGRDACSISTMCHSFPVLEPDGTILDTLETVRLGNIYKDYTGTNLIIGRFTKAAPENVQKAIQRVKQDIGKIYPYWRLAADAFDLGRIIHSDSKVCSERSVWAGWLAFGFEPFRKWAGWTPGQLAFVLKYCKGFQIVFEGTL